MSLPRTAAAAALLVLLAAPLAPAHAGCTGTDSTVKVCVPDVDPTGGPGVHDCVALGDPANCKQVDAPTPSLDGTTGYTCGACPDAGALVQDAKDKAQPTVDRVNQTLDLLTRLQCAPSRSAAAIPPPPPTELSPVVENLSNFVKSCL